MGVRDGRRADGQIGTQLAPQRRDFARRPEDFEAAIHDREPCRVIAAILEALQTFEDERGCRPVPGVAYDAAHECRPSSIKRSAAALVGASAINRIIGSVPDGRTCSQRSGHASRSPSCVSAVASRKYPRSAAYTSPIDSAFRVPRSNLALTIV